MHGLFFLKSSGNHILSVKTNFFNCSGTKNKVFAKFYYKDDEYPGHKTLLNSQLESGSYNQQFRPDQENAFTVWIPDWNKVNLSHIQIGFETIPTPDDDWIIKELRIYDHLWRKYLFISSRSVRSITKTRPTIELIRQREVVKSHTVSQHHISSHVVLVW